MADESTPTEATEPSQPDQTPQQVLQDLACQIRQAPVTDTQTAREVRFTEDEAKAMADSLEALAQRLDFPTSEETRTHNPNDFMQPRAGEQ